jgi:hypothetical protein
LDAHPPEGVDRPDLPPNTVLSPPQVYDIPLRSLYSRNIANLFMAGRNISASYVAFTSARVMATCAVEGQAVGTAAAQCVEAGITPRQLARDPKQVALLQERLLRDDQTIKGRRSEDASDVARRAAVTASALGETARLVIDGFTRDIPDGRGNTVEAHQWAAPAPAWIELQWERPQRLREVQITFDSGFRRQLTLSASDGQNANIVRAPQPETVKDYRIVCGGRTVVSVSGNFQRVVRHRFDAVETRSLRLEVESTNGDPLARVFEIRCYG